MPHSYEPSRRFHGGDLDCGNGLLLLLRKHIDPLAAGQLLEIISSVPSVADDLPAWCRLTQNELVSVDHQAEAISFLVCKGPFTANLRAAEEEGTSVQRAPAPVPLHQELETPVWLAELPQPVPALPIPPLSVMGIGSWPRPPWMLRATHGYLSGTLSETEFEATARDSVRLSVAAQVAAGVDVVTDGEQWRDDYASFVGQILQNCQLIPVQDLLPYVDHPAEFAAALDRLDVPADVIRFPAVFGPLGRRRPLARHELEFLQQICQLPTKVALPGPYLLTRTMWMECFSDRAYANREALAKDIVRVLREETHDLLAHGASLIQFDEPVLTEVVLGQASHNNRSFMCGALSQKGPIEAELEFAADLLRQVVAGIPADRVALHVCRGNWTTDERAALTGNYQPLLSHFQQLPVGTLFLEMCTPRAGEWSILKQLPDSMRIGVGLINQKHATVESVDEVVARANHAIDLWGAERVLLNPDCGFATFADSPVSSSDVAQAKLHVLAQAAQILRQQHHRS